MKVTSLPITAWHLARRSVFAGQVGWNVLGRVDFLSGLKY